MRGLLFVRSDTDDVLVNERGEKASFTLIYGSKGIERHLTVLQQEFRRAGVDMRLRLLEPATAFERGLERKYEMTLTGRTAGFYPALRQYLHTEFKNKTNNNNIWGFGTPEVDELVRTYEEDLSFEARLKAVHRIEEIVREEAFYLPFWSAPYIRVVYWDYVRWPETWLPRRTEQLMDWQGPARRAGRQGEALSDSGPLLDIDRLQVGFDSEAGLVRAVDGVSLSIAAGQTVGLVGESGCGKSVTAASILRLVPSPPGRILGGAIRFDGRDILALPADELTALRGRDIAMVFQDPMTSLNPVFTVEWQLWEVLKLRFGLERGAARERAAQMLSTVGIADAQARLAAYPHELSGGMKQRVMIAMALLCEPRLLIADEPTTALDVTVQAQILHLMRELQRRTGAALLFITHDMGVIAEMCDRVVVMYAGRIVERRPAVELFEAPRHPYTRGLLDSIPRRAAGRKAELPTIEGTVPSLLAPPPGCRFADRCRRRAALGEAERARCLREDPPLAADGSGDVACHFPLPAARQEDR